MYSFVKYRRRLNQPIQQSIESKEVIKPKYSDVDLMSMEQYLSFSWLDYLLINDDLLEHNICTKLLAFRHYIEFGQSENRETKQQYFHWVDYLIANEDLLKNGIQTKEESYFYYMKHKNENRPLKSKQFNWIHYYALTRCKSNARRGIEKTFIHWHLPHLTSFTRRTTLKILKHHSPLPFHLQATPRHRSSEHDRQKRFDRHRAMK